MRAPKLGRRSGLTFCLLFAGIVAIYTPAGADDRNRFTAAELSAIERHAAPLAVRTDPTNKFADDARAAKLGQVLFFDRRLSGGGRFSCASCHEPSKGFTDGRPVAEAIAISTRNTPTLIDAADNLWFFWDGRADTMWAQVLQVVENPSELGGDRLAVAHAIADDPALRRAYERIFGSLPSLADTTRFPNDATPSAEKSSLPAQAWERMSDRDRDAV